MAKLCRGIRFSIFNFQLTDDGNTIVVKIGNTLTVYNKRKKLLWTY